MQWLNPDWKYLNGRTTGQRAPVTHSGWHKTFRGPGTLLVKQRTRINTQGQAGRCLRIYLFQSIYLFIFLSRASWKVLFGTARIQKEEMRGMEVISTWRNIGPWNLMANRAAGLAHPSNPSPGISFGLWKRKKLMDSWDDPPLSRLLRN